MVVGSSARPALHLRAALLPPVSMAVFALALVATFAVAGSTLGYDFHAYYEAASRVLAGQPLYDASATVAGPQGVYLYPPPFALAVLPFALLPEALARAAWLVLLVAAFLAGTAILPVPRSVRWAVLLLAGLSWPFIFAMKLGQVGPLLYLAFAVGWRWLERDDALALSAAAGAAIKLQPGLLVPWQLLVGRWRAAAVTIGALAVLAVVSTLVLGAGVWADYVALLGRVSDPLTTSQNLAPGALATAAGLPSALATAIQWGSVGLVLVAVAVGTRWSSIEASYLSVVPASQLIAPVLWDHYAMLLLVPVAWLLARRRWWAAIIPLATPVFLVGTIPPVAYPVAIWVTLVAVLVEGHRRAAIVEPRPVAAPRSATPQRTDVG